MCAVSELLTQPGRDAVGRRPWCLIGCAVSNEGSYSIAAICESSTSLAGGQAGATLASLRLELGGGVCGRFISLVQVEI